MIRNRLYYRVKPFIPRPVRFSARRWIARRRLKGVGSVWPVLPGSEVPPEGWCGWPQGKQFAFALTHDVEGQLGVDRVRQLAELEISLGFRSSFNFIPEGDYRVPVELRRWLVDNGFEVGVHDLRHDGLLYTSREHFRDSASRINHWLKEWNASGFRSGFMLHNLDWYYDLDLLYDASTFDTDPFEPQPDGVGTIFPFWVTPGEAGTSPAPRRGASKARAGFAELPYTLPQDSTLFLLLRERTPEIWLRKLDWIASKGGMALVNVHPDYLNFDQSRPTPHTFPISHYADLLKHVRDRYANVSWHALPREIAQHVAPRSDTVAPQPAVQPASAGVGSVTALEALQTPQIASAGRIVMLVENSYPGDTRVRNEALLLQSTGYEVSVIALGKPGIPRFEVINGVRVYRIRAIELFKKTIAERPGVIGRALLAVKALVGYGFEYLYFTTGCFLVTSYIFVRHGLDAIHANNPPDTLFLAAIPFKLLGKKFIFDHHDLSPELYRSRYNTGECMQTRILRFLEWCSLKMANVTIATNDSYKQIQIERAAKDPESIFVVRNGPNAERMRRAEPSERLRAMNKRILVYVGCLNPQDGVDYLLRSLNHLKRDLGRRDFHCVVIGAGDSLMDLRALAKELDIEDCVELPGYISTKELKASLAAADICVDPDPSSPLNDVSTWIKIMEYMANAKPIVTYDLKETRFSARDSAVYVPPNDEMAFAKAISDLMDDPERRSRMGAYGRKRVEDELQWSVVGKNLLDAYAFALNRPRRRPATEDLG